MKRIIACHPHQKTEEDGEHHLGESEVLSPLGCRVRVLSRQLRRRGRHCLPTVVSTIIFGKLSN